jgi:hypothetical protein
MDSAIDLRKSLNFRSFDALGALGGGRNGCDERMFTMSDIGS